MMRRFSPNLVLGPTFWYRPNGLLIVIMSLLIAGCGPATEDVADGPEMDSAESAVVEEMKDSELDRRTASVVNFSTWEGNDVAWEIAEGKSQHLYATTDFTDQTAPNLVIEQWIGEAPKFDGKKFLLIDFWATWCPPCRASIPELNEISKKFANELIVVGLSDESVAKVQEMEQPVIEYYSAVDTESRTKTEIGVQGIPHVMLIDPSGKVAWQGFPMGEADPLTAERIQEIMDRYHAL